MANFSNYKISLHLFLVLALSMVMMMMQVHSELQLIFDIDNNFNESSDGLTYERDAHVPPGTRQLSLIGRDAEGNPNRSSVGRVLYTTPFTFWGEGRQPSFSTYVTFRVRPIVNPGEGMTLFIAPVNSTKSTGGEGENLGLYDALNEGTPFFAVEFHVNNGDPNSAHVGINVNSAVSQNVTKYNITTGQLVMLTINYDGRSGLIRVIMVNNAPNSTMEYVYDLKTILPQQVQVGLSASTGPDFASNFNVLQWFFMSHLKPDDVDEEEDNTNISRQYVA